MDLSFFKRQLASVIEWTNQQPNILLFKYPSDNDEIKNASKLIIGPGQGVLLVYEGTVTDTLPEPGIYNLETDNHPFITTLLKFRTAFESEHKLKIYFFRTSENTDQNWGTATPIKYIDPVYKFPVALGSNGNFSFHLSDPTSFFTHVSGFSNLYTTVQARALLQSRISQLMASGLANGQFSYQQIDAQLNSISKNPGGIASAGISLATGLSLGRVFADHQEQETGDPVARLQKLKLLLNEGIITQEEFDQKKKEWLDKL